MGDKYNKLLDFSDIEDDIDLGTEGGLDFEADMDLETESIDRDEDGSDYDDAFEDSEELGGIEDTGDVTETAGTANTEGSDGSENSKGIEKEEYLLYMVTDKPKNGLLTFFRERGIKVTKIFSSIAAARDELVMQIDPFRLVVLDTGTGKFTSTTNRKQIIDIVSLSDESIHVTVFYTDSILKLETNANIKNKKAIDWFNFVSTSDVLAKLLFYSLSEEYIYETENPSGEAFQSKDSVMKLKGTPFTGKEGSTIAITGIDGESLSRLLLSEDTESVQRYTIKLKV